ncbi:MAG: M24 family metallopeptidase [Candidatus Helarchaeota archaeon]
MNEFDIKEKKLIKFLNSHDLNGIILSKQQNFSWITCGGDNHVVSSSDLGVATIMITPTDRIMICKNNEKNRLIEEELKNLGFKVIDFPWYGNLESELKKIINDGNDRFGSDTIFHSLRTKYIENDLMELRLVLIGDEINRAKKLGQEISNEFEFTCKSIQSGMTELEISAIISSNLLKIGIYPAVLLIAVDERIFKYRHPIPTKKKLKNYAMLVIVGKRNGIHIAMTRFIHFGKISTELKNKLHAIGYIDAGLINNSRIGSISGDVIKQVIYDYKKVGFENEWKLHHQGGAIAYNPREYIANMDSKYKILENSMMAWNPSITGVKSEDTILIQKGKNTILTQTDDWPLLEINYNNTKYFRPDILIN